MKVKTLWLFCLALFTGMLFFASFTVPQEPKKGGDWDIPEKYKEMENPFTVEDKKMVKLGKMLYSKHCRSCHGNEGKGDGPKARQLETYPGDFTSEEFQSQGDGTIYYQSIIGRDEMPNYEKKIEYEEDRWAIVTYIRTLGE